MGIKTVGQKKKKRITDLNASDESGDGDSGSDFVLSESDKSEASEDINNSDSEDSEFSGRRRGTRRSQRERRRRSDDDFVVDDSDSEEEPRKKRRVHEGRSPVTLVVLKEEIGEEKRGRKMIPQK